MDQSISGACLRCGNCCTRFGVCVTPFDILRIVEATGLAPSRFVSSIPEPSDRERTEPAILIDGEPRLLVLRWKRARICMFFSKKGCRIYEDRPMLCRTYPFRFETGHRTNGHLVDMGSRACPMFWKSSNPQYESDLLRYESELKRYRAIAEKWNKSIDNQDSKDLASFLSFALHEIKKPRVNSRWFL